MRMKLDELPADYRAQVERQLAAPASPAGPSNVARCHDPAPDAMNKLERDYARKLDLDVAAGRILGYLFGSIKLRLADRTWYTPDFAVFTNTREIVFIETKGFMRDDAAVKLKVAAEQYPRFRFKLVTRSKGQWIETPIGRR